MRSIKRWVKQFLCGRRHYRFLARHFFPPQDAEAARWLHATMRSSGYLQTENLSPPCGRILVMAPHPDDEALGPGGTLIGARAEALAVVYLTSGKPGEGVVREKEAESACRQLGAQAHFLRLTDGGMATEGEAATRLASIIEQFSPDVLMLPFMLDDHPDHRRASLLLDAACDSFSPKPEIWAYQVYSAIVSNVVVDITPWRDDKINLIHLYSSQVMHRDWANFSLGLNAWNSRLLKVDGASWAEAFTVLPLEEYRRLTQQYRQDLIDLDLRT